MSLSSILFFSYIFSCIDIILSSNYKSELILKDSKLIGEVIKSNRPLLSLTDIPISWDYREKGLLTMDLNQHIPVYW